MSHVGKGVGEGSEWNRNKGKVNIQLHLI